MMEHSLKNMQLQKMMPQTMHSLQLLPLPLIMLKGYLGNLVLDNPFLEPRFDEMELPMSECVRPEEPEGELYERHEFRERKESELLPLREEIFRRDEDSLYEHLRLQVELSGLDEAEAAVARHLIAGINDSGYLDESAEDAAEALRCPIALVERVLEVVQRFSPTGVGARNLSECLCLQVDSRRADAGLLKQILRDDLSALAERQFAFLARKYKVSRPRIQELLDYVQTLEPRPGGSFSAQRFTQYIIPDASVDLSGPQPVIEIRGEADSLLSFDPDYMKDAEEESACEFLRQKRQEAQNLLGSLDMRYHALEQMARYLAVKQRAFFTDGPLSLRPLTQKQAAEDLGMHPSTVSRCIRDKYIGTAWGSFPMSYFFSGGLGNGGNDCAAELARSAVGALIATEDKTAPLRDIDIAQRLRAQGIIISRRTVAKYRAQLGLGGQAARIRYE